MINFGTSVEMMRALPLHQLHLDILIYQARSLFLCSIIQPYFGARIAFDATESLTSLPNALIQRNPSRATHFDYHDDLEDLDLRCPKQSLRQNLHPSSEWYVLGFLGLRKR